MKILHAEGILARRYFYPGCHRMEPYKTIYPNIGERLKNTEKLSERVICLPTGTSITAKEIVLICELIRFIVRHGRDISKKLKDRSLS